MNSLVDFLTSVSVSVRYIIGLSLASRNCTSYLSGECLFTNPEYALYPRLTVGLAYLVGHTTNLVSVTLLPSDLVLAESTLWWKPIGILRIQDLKSRL
jgi:hypothetical protein